MEPVPRPTWRATDTCHVATAAIEIAETGEIEEIAVTGSIETAAGIDATAGAAVAAAGVAVVGEAAVVAADRRPSLG
jgi:hypothetical protein